MPSLTMLTPAQLQDRRAQLLRQAGLDETDLRRLGEQYALSPSQSTNQKSSSNASPSSLRRT